jgi:predicted Zn-dependent protease
MSRARFEEASVCFREAIGLSPSLDSARVGSAVAYLALAKPTEAMAVLEPLIKRQDPQAIVLAGRILSTDDRFEDAVAVIGAAILTHPKSAGLHSARGQHLFSLGRFAAAAAAFEKALQYDPADPSSWFGLASAVVKLDDEKRARLALAGYLGIAHPADVARVRFAQRELTRLAVK